MSLLKQRKAPPSPPRLEGKEVLAGKDPAAAKVNLTELLENVIERMGCDTFACIFHSYDEVILPHKTQINLSWTNNSTNQTGVMIERCRGSTCTNFSLIATVTATATT